MLSPQGAVVRELEVSVLSDSAKLVLGTLVQERDYTQSVKAFNVIGRTQQEHTL